MTTRMETRHSKPISILKMIRKNFTYFKKSFFINIGFESIYKVLTSFIFLPFITMVLNYFMHLREMKMMANNQILSFVGSIPGILTILILGILSFLFIFIEYAGLIVISQETYFDKKISAKTAFFTAMKSIRGIMKVGSIPIIIYVLFIIPFVASSMGLSSSLLPKIEIPTFIMDVVYKTPKWISLYAIVFFILFYFLIRWIFSLHVVVLEGKDFSSALKRSSQLVKGSFLKIWTTMFLWNLSIFAIVAVVVILVGIGMVLLNEVLKGNVKLFVTILSFVTTMGGILVMIATLFISPLTIMLITQLYYRQVKMKDGVEPIPMITTSTPSKINWQNLFNRHKKKLIAVSVLGIMIFTWLSYVYFITYEFDANNNLVTVTAHRGDAVNAPDNTMSSLLGAIANKADYCELDVQETKDGVVVLTHDTNLKNSTGVNKNIWELAFDEVEKLDVGSHFSPKFAGEKIPTLGSIMKAANKKIKLNIEIKLNGHDQKLEERVVKLIEDNNFVDQCVVTSLDYNALQKVKKLNPKIKVGYIVFAGMGDVTALNVDFLSVEEAVATPEFIEKVHKTNKRIHVWTINDPEKMEKFIDLQVDSIITDNSKEVTRLIQEKKDKQLRNEIDYIYKIVALFND
ncbi:glycerophosphoryl diester phosphodiesterase membrane domain-containing protein [Clostridium botulinum]|uniref:glycerophosphoryl diester phosphodiesterase membrane domain-containing protein n=1 Tax=Clostridium botulinum TaxID=1491 RepID=UPI000772D527|nr:glycerophosphodiester phosphodiesterase [Clostridium botulinum]MBY6950982.1 glycerophosphoryl diester phosphodiesterase membrane domain-containing protein [Clostridium botulinum]MCR1140357.1 glycerophosphodiester phosphodiesterase [Clostridium botulinum]NEZ80162.1 glycerophosphodiester phosphodiesterase [Clostridium botulinum]NFA17641.1 glycerophosphodiester phosphodiesterase [Clostridium botulinum]NFA53666.1 glycerophosphodiester phosphodiesterase [Clostridium botulinum]